MIEGSAPHSVQKHTNTISLRSVFLSLASSSTLVMGPRIFLNRSMFSSSNLARVSVSIRSTPSWKFSISMRACNALMVSMDVDETSK